MICSISARGSPPTPSFGGQARGVVNPRGRERGIHPARENERAEASEFKVRSRAAAIAILIIRWYQRTLSPDHGFLRHLSLTGGRCRFFPSCSEYACQAMERQGFCKGMISALARLGRCHPWSHGGYDPVDS